MPKDRFRPAGTHTWERCWRRGAYSGGAGDLRRLRGKCVATDAILLARGGVRQGETCMNRWSGPRSSFRSLAYDCGRRRDRQASPDADPNGGYSGF